MTFVRPKKKLGQHFLKDLTVAERIAKLADFSSYGQILEIGPGMGVLTQFLPWDSGKVTVIEIDNESINYLNNTFPELKDNIHQGDFLKVDLSQIMGRHPFGIIGNFPYNISTQIVFKTLEYRDKIPFFAGMFQKEVAERICEPPGSKKYGILSVFAQLFYTVDYVFTVPPQVFNPPPKVDSGVICMHRKENYVLACDEKMLFRIVKQAFQQRRKTLRNSLKSLGLSKNITEDSIFDQRPEKLSGADFVALTKKITHG